MPEMGNWIDPTASGLERRTDLSLLRAEWKKVTGNLLVTGFLVWIIPVGVLAFYVLGLLMFLVTEDPSSAGIVSVSAGSLTTDMVGVWSLIITFPGNILGRLLPLAFMAVLFAGEYQWGTLRQIVPRSRRSSLILAKVAIATFIVLISYILASLIIGVGQSAGHAMLGLDYGSIFAADELSRLAESYFQHLLLGTLSLLILTGFAAVAAVLTRSILGGLLASFGLSVLEPMSLVFLVVLGRLLNRADLANLYQFAATYHLDNARSWFVAGHPLAPPLPGFAVEPALVISLIALALWIIVPVALAIVLFNRQDITS
jgi:ABC-type transport system involved in multi-copper enzyme maturation permease subunit